MKGLDYNTPGRIDIKQDGNLIAYVDNKSTFIELKVNYNQSTIIEFFSDLPAESWEINGREVTKGDYLSIFPIECNDGTYITANFVAW